MTTEETNMTIDYLESMKEKYIEGEGYERHPLPEWFALDYAIQVLEKTRWTHVKWHYITDRERVEEGYAQDLVYCFDNKMPNNKERILVQTKDGYITIDVNHVDNEYHLDSGYDWRKDIVAWMPLSSLSELT